MISRLTVWLWDESSQIHNLDATVSVRHCEFYKWIWKSHWIKWSCYVQFHAVCFVNFLQSWAWAFLLRIFFLENKHYSKQNKCSIFTDSKSLKIYSTVSLWIFYEISKPILNPVKCSTSNMFRFRVTIFLYQFVRF